MLEPLVSMRGVTKFIYGGDGRPLRNTDVKILEDVDFDLFPGEVHVLVGENGAGKSTLMRILGGIIPPDRGELKIAGARVNLADARDAREKGVAFIHQELNLCANLDVAHNIFLGREPRRRGLKDAGEMYRRSAELLKALSTDLDPRLPVARLSTAQQQLVEIAKAMSFRSRVVIMDEPTASLTKREIDVLFDLIRRMRAEGIGIVYISHRFEEILAIGDRFTVLRDGRLVGTLPIQSFEPNSVIWMMAGRSIDEMYPRTHAVDPEPVLELRGLRLAAHTPPIDLMVRRGEVVGLGGLVGSGRTELAKSVFGARRFHGGEVRYLGRKTNGWSPARLIRAGMAYLSEDRKTEGLIPPMSIRENLKSGLSAVRGQPGLPVAAEGGASGGQAHPQLSIVARSSEQLVSTLSGGNQQKCVLGKWLCTAPRLLMLDEPTRGIDVGAKAQIHKLIDQIAGAGVGHPHDQQRAARAHRHQRPGLRHARGRGGGGAGGGTGADPGAGGGLHGVTGPSPGGGLPHFAKVRFHGSHQHRSGSASVEIPRRRLRSFGFVGWISTRGRRAWRPRSRSLQCFRHERAVAKPSRVGDGADLFPVCRGRAMERSAASGSGSRRRSASPWGDRSDFWGAYVVPPDMDPETTNSKRTD